MMMFVNDDGEGAVRGCLDAVFTLFEVTFSGVLV
jgi:hypothetical protein